MDLINTENPWYSISPGDYENHMSDPAVQQLQLLNRIFQEQYRDYPPQTLVYLGVCTGNGLEHIDPDVTDSVWGIDVNEGFLALCADRYARRIKNLQLLKVDINHALLEATNVDLIIANLVLEYIDTERFFRQIDKIAGAATVTSLVFQDNKSIPAVSPSGTTALQVLSGFHRDLDLPGLENLIAAAGFHIFKTLTYNLPGGKDFVRVDFRRV
jgi:hypothetical protein